jgi:hypothetical protein
MKIEAKKSRRQANQLLQLCELGNAFVFKTLVNGDRKYTVCAKSGRELALVGEKYRFEFERFFNSHGTGDGLFPGCDQTTIR